MIREKQFNQSEAKKDPIGLFYQYTELHNNYFRLINSTEFKLIENLKQLQRETITNEKED